MAAEFQLNTAPIRAAFQAYEHELRVRNYKVGCLLGIIFMPAGVSLDYFVYPVDVSEFLGVRLLCSLLLGVLWTVFHFFPKIKGFRFLGGVMTFLPLLAITWMIYRT